MRVVRRVVLAASLDGAVGWAAPRTRGEATSARWPTAGPTRANVSLLGWPGAPDARRRAFPLNKGIDRLSQRGMKRTTVVVPWRDGLHLVPAGELVRLAGRFRSAIHLRRGGRIADARRLFSVVALCATMGTALVLEVSGEDEGPALETLRQVFSSAGDA